MKIYDRTNRIMCNTDRGECEGAHSVLARCKFLGEDVIRYSGLELLHTTRQIHVVYYNVVMVALTFP